MHVVHTAILLSLGALLGATIVLARQQPSSPITGANYLYIEEYEIPAGASINDVIAEASQWVRDFRNTGEYKSVRLFIHNSGPALALYILQEPNNWQAIETGANKFFAARPDIMSNPIKWGRRSDNILNEIPVE
jgi:hypothetical protein